MLDVRRIDGFRTVRRHEDLHGFVVIADGAGVERTLVADLIRRPSHHCSTARIAMRFIKSLRSKRGFGWTRWSRQWMHANLRLFNGYRIRRPLPKVIQRPLIVR